MKRRTNTFLPFLFQAVAKSTKLAIKSESFFYVGLKTNVEFIVMKCEILGHIHFYHFCLIITKLLSVPNWQSKLNSFCWPQNKNCTIELFFITFKAYVVQIWICWISKPWKKDYTPCRLCLNKLLSVANWQVYILKSIYIVSLKKLKLYS